MEAKKLVPGNDAPEVKDEPVVIQETGNEQVAGKPGKKRKRKHISALEAVSKTGSVVDEANARSSGDVDYGNTGTNLTYKEKGGIL